MMTELASVLSYESILLKITASVLIVLALIVVKTLVDKVLLRVMRGFSLSARNRRIGLHLTEQYVKPTRHLFSLVFLVIGILILMGIWGLSDVFGSVLIGAGVTAVVVGFAAQGVLSDFIAGVMIILDSPFSIGEWISVGDADGIVTDVSLRSTRIKSFDGEYVTIPNRKIAEQVVVNKSRRTKLRLSVSIGVDYEADVEKAIKIAEKVMESQELVLDDPPPEAIVSELAASSVNLSLRFWVRKIGKDDTLRLKSEVITKTKKKLEEAGMSIPFQHIELIQHKN